MGRLVSFLVLGVLIIPLLVVGCTQQAPTATVTVTSPAPAPAPAPVQTVQINVWSAPLGSGMYLFGLASEKIANANLTGIRAINAEAQGGVINLQKYGETPNLWENTIIGTGGPALAMSKKVIEPFTSQIVGMRTMFGYIQSGSFLVTLNPNIKTIQDLAGKKVALGRATQENYGLLPTMAIQAAGLADKMDIRYLGPGPAVSALIDGTVDAAISAAYYDVTTMKEIAPSPEFIQLLSSGKKLYYISYGTDAIKKLESDGYVAYVEIPAGLLKDQDAPLPTYMLTAFWAAKDVFPEDIAYELTKVWLDHTGDFAQYYDIGKFVSPAFSYRTIVFGNLTEQNIHPGSLRAYKEAGLVK